MRLLPSNVSQQISSPVSRRQHPQRRRFVHQVPTPISRRVFAKGACTQTSQAKQKHLSFLWHNSILDEGTHFEQAFPRSESVQVLTM
jgi:hypothetical protein